MNKSKERPGISGSTIKIIALAIMLIDHSAAVLIEGLLQARGFFQTGLSENEYLDMINSYSTLYTVDLVMRLIGRIAFPLFIFLLVEGAKHTKDKLQYAFRLSLFALISEVAFDLAFYRHFLEFSHQNIFFTLAFGMYMIYLYDRVLASNKNGLFFKCCSVLGMISPAIFLTWQYHISIQLMVSDVLRMPSISPWIAYCVSLLVLSIISVFLVFFIRRRSSGLTINKIGTSLLLLFMFMSIATYLNTDYGGIGILSIAIMYVLRANITHGFLFGSLALVLSQPFELPAILGLIPIRLYNGERGLKLKYVFYIFYPLHLLILYLISTFIY